MKFSGYSQLTGRISDPLKFYDDPSTKLRAEWPNMNYHYYKKGTLMIFMNN